MTLYDASVQASPYVKQNDERLRVGILERNKIFDKAAQHSFFEDFLSRRFAKELRNGRRRISFAQTLRKMNAEWKTSQQICEKKCSKAHLVARSRKEHRRRFQG